MKAVAWRTSAVSSVLSQNRLMPTLRLTRKREAMHSLNSRAQGEKPMGGFGHGLWIQNKSAHGNELLQNGRLHLLLEMDDLVVDPVAAAMA